MIKFAGHDTSTGRMVIGIGLSRANCERLLAGYAIEFDTRGMVGLPEVQVALIARETDAEFVAEFLQKAVITPDQILPDTAQGVHPVDNDETKDVSGVN